MSNKLFNEGKLENLRKAIIQKKLSAAREFRDKFLVIFRVALFDEETLA